MEQRRCYGCMELTDQPVCPRCGKSAVENPPHQLRTGTVLAGKYLVGRALNQSPLGIYYLGLDQVRGEKVILLEYFPAQDAKRSGNLAEPLTSRFAEGKARFAQVSGLLAADPVLAKTAGFLGGFEENGTAYRVAEQIRGTSLDRYVRMRGGSLDAQEALRILEPVLRAAAAAHRAGLAHGGIRMETIALDPMGGARLQGFGENPGASLQEDVLALSRVILGCLTEGGERLSVCPEYIPGLTVRQCGALKMGLAPNPEERFASAAALCGALLSAEAPDAPVPDAAAPAGSPPKKRGKLWIWISAAVAALVLVFLGLLLFGVHIWLDADCTHAQKCLICGKTEGNPLGHKWESATCLEAKTCTRCGETQGSELGHHWLEASCLAPKTCERCGETQGTAVGHSWEAASCTAPKTCRNCGETQGTALGHEWTEATYTAPETCKRCGETRGNVRGYHESVTGSYERFYSTKVNGWCLKLDEPIIGCRRFTLTVEVSNISYGSPEGSWKAFYRNTKGEWIDLGNFTMTGTSASVEIVFDTPVDVDSVTAVYNGSGNFSFSKDLYVTDVYAAD